MKAVKAKDVPPLRSYMVRWLRPDMSRSVFNQSENWEEIDQDEMDEHLQKPQDFWFQTRIGLR